jgi:DNA-binding NarL/FixJ family response regulator
MQDDPNLAAAALELGPIGFVLKVFGGSELLKAIDSVLRDQVYLTPRLAPVDWVEAKQRPRQYKKKMTSRQTDVIQLIAEGRATKEVADVLGLSKGTVEFHKYRVMQSFGFKNKADLVLFALQQGLISPPAICSLETANTRSKQIPSVLRQKHRSLSARSISDLVV